MRTHPMLPALVLALSLGAAGCSKKTTNNYITRPAPDTGVAASNTSTSPVGELPPEGDFLSPEPTSLPSASATTSTSGAGDLTLAATPAPGGDLPAEGDLAAEGDTEVRKRRRWRRHLRRRRRLMRVMRRKHAGGIQKVVIRTVEKPDGTKVITETRALPASST